jgi:Invasin, domain 3
MRPRGSGDRGRRRPRPVACRPALIAALAAAWLLIGASSAWAAPIESFSAAPSTTQAGGHPDWSVSFSLDHSLGAGTAQSVTYEAPAGDAILPTATPTCSTADLALTECPFFSQVGLVTIRAGYEGDAEFLLGTVPLYAVVSSTDLARFAFTLPALKTSVVVVASLRTGDDYGLRLRLEELPESTPIAALAMTVWGVPADVTHDEARFPVGSEGEPPGCPGLEDTSCITMPTKSGVVVRPLTRNPSVCDGGLSARLEVRTYELPASLVTAKAAYPETTGCDQQKEFNPSFQVEPTSADGFSPTGLDLEYTVPQSQPVATPAPSELESAALVLPAEMGLYPFVPEGEVECGEGANFESEDPASCPPGSELGTASLYIAGLSAPLTGEIYLWYEEESGEEWEIGLLLVAAGDGVEVKLPIWLWEEPEEGRLALGLLQPQLPIGLYQLHLDGGERALLRTPVHCGEYEAEAVFVPWNDVLPTQVAEEEVTVGAGPAGGPCIGQAAQVGVALAPATVLADGGSQSVATVDVTDEHGAGVPEEDVVLDSSDPAVRVGELTDHEDGTYTATITSSTAPGTPTITATDHSAGDLSGSATLTQKPLPPAPAPAGVPPRVRFSVMSHWRTTSHRVRFVFHADSAGSSFSCRIDRGRYRPCTSPLLLHGLSAGRHVLSVRATDSAGTGPPATARFRVVRPAHHRHRHHKKHRG